MKRGNHGFFHPRYETSRAALREAADRTGLMTYKVVAVWMIMLERASENRGYFSSPDALADAQYMDFSVSDYVDIKEALLDMGMLRFDEKRKMLKIDGWAPRYTKSVERTVADAKDKREAEEARREFEAARRSAA